MGQGPFFDHQFKINVMEEDHFSLSSSIGDDSSTTTSSSSSSSSSFSSDTADDASSNSSSYDLSDLMAQLPIKRGLSNFYQGKSQSFTSHLSSLKSIQDLAKKESPYTRKIKASKSYAGGLDTYKSHTLPKPTISKKNSSRTSFRKPTFPRVCHPPPPQVPAAFQHNL